MLIYHTKRKILKFNVLVKTPRNQLQFFNINSIFVILLIMKISDRLLLRNLGTDIYKWECFVDFLL